MTTYTTKQALLPGVGYINETNNTEQLLPGGAYINETQTVVVTTTNLDPLWFGMTF